MTAGPCSGPTAAELDRLGCAALADRPFGVLSQGERQKVLVARALVADPLCLVLDEPCAGMDPGAREQFPGWLATHLCAGGPAVILVTHHVEEILPVFDWTLILREGRALSRGATADVLTRDAFEALDGTRLDRLEKCGGRHWPIWAGAGTSVRQAGTYPGDIAVWSADGLVIRGADTTVEHVEFSGGRVPDKNGADPQSDVLVEHSEFHHNGAGDGYSHNLYIGQVRSFTLRFCSSHHKRTGHLVKSRAQASSILYNWLMDEADGTSSYVIDLPNGGRSVVIGNIIHHGPRAENGLAVSYGAEGAKNDL